MSRRGVRRRSFPPRRRLGTSTEAPATVRSSVHTHAEGNVARRTELHERQERVNATVRLGLSAESGRRSRRARSRSSLPEPAKVIRGRSLRPARSARRDAARRRVARACPDTASRHRRRHRTLPRAARPNLSSRRRSFFARRASLHAPRRQFTLTTSSSPPLPLSVAVLFPALPARTDR